MNWQTEKVRNWIEDSKICISTLNITQLQEYVESQLLVKHFSTTDHLRNLAITELLKNVEWKELVFNPNAWYDYDYDDVESELEELRDAELEIMRDLESGEYWNIGDNG
jgi:hypothetical protein